MSPGATTTQLNVRIDRDLKEAGDRVLADVGLTPSDFVRLMWGGASRGANVVRQVADLLEPSAPTSMDEETARRLDLLERGQRLFDEGLVRLALSGETTPNISEEEMQSARFNHLFEKGLS